ncbi:unnamed protein product [Cylindrotheca closterium]|uniref:Uncharacterized protein n=1 Tax=Cylindrotheca closterium TaxID=2856 RepID=A0AAD2PWW5_9STRA|nr:unnamed protein product [Cylindrotheca closterium]
MNNNISNSSQSKSKEDEEVTIDFSPEEAPSSSLWTPSGNFLKDFIHFSGPGWLVSIAYVDPGNYQADIQAGATTRYNLLFTLFWTSLLSIYVQVLCVRLALYGKLNLAEAQAKYSAKTNAWLRYFEWFIAEFSTIITDLPGIVGFAIAARFFFDVPYIVGLLFSLLTTMVFLSTLNSGFKILEGIICIFVGIMSIAIFTEMATVQPSGSDIMRGWMLGFLEVKQDDIFSIAGIIGAVVMPHNLYLHSGDLKSRSFAIKQSPDVIDKAAFYCSIEPIAPILISFFINLAVVAVAAETVYGSDDASKVGLTDFCNYFQSLPNGCFLWAVALLAAGQSGAITTTYTGQYVMDGFLNLQIPLALRAIITRLVAITPSILVCLLVPDKLNELVNVVNALLGFLLPFAFTPLVKYNCEERVMGKGNASKGFEKALLYMFALLVWAINAVTLSIPGGGFFGEVVPNMEMSISKALLIALQMFLQIGYAWWNFKTLFENLDKTDDVEEMDASSQELVPMGREQGELT